MEKAAVALVYKRQGQKSPIHSPEATSPERINGNKTLKSCFQFGNIPFGFFGYELLNLILPLYPTKFAIL